jgi:nitrite reductase (NADH) small subunit
MTHEFKTTTWSPVCSVDDIVPNTGVCALVKDRHVAVFHVKDIKDSEDNGDEVDRLFAIDNYDPNAEASVLSRGLVGNLGERVVVASPIYKHHFDLQSGECLEAPEKSVNAYPVRIENRTVWVAV